MVASEQVLATGQQLDTLCINTIRTLAIDAVQQANSGHPGAPMGLAPVTYCLWQEFLRYDPADPTWRNRDRFVLSNGHASMLLYAMLHLAEVRRVDKNGKVLKDLAVPMDEIKRFRQLGSLTPGHPESHITSGVETTTGPLGQGVGNSVGMAIAGKWQAANFNSPGLEILARAFETFHKTTDRPTLIIVDSHIGYGSPHKQDSNAAHGEPLGEDEVKLGKKFYGWPEGV